MKLRLYFLMLIYVFLVFPNKIIVVTHLTLVKINLMLSVMESKLQ